MHIIEHEGESYFKICNHDAMRPFFMSIVSDSDHWMFMASNGGLTAGRRNPEYALFPYYTDDKITESADLTGSKTILQVKWNNVVIVWEPFSNRCFDKYEVSRNLYKSIYGNKVIFEEINHDLQLAFRIQWATSNEFGFVRHASIINFSANSCRINILDGIQNVMPSSVSSDLQRSTSNLVDAYKRSELEASSGLGIFALSAIIVDKAEPSEALKANIVWATGVQHPKHLLSSLQLDKFRQKQQVSAEWDVKGEKGAYFLVFEVVLNSNAPKSWKLVANVNQNHSQIIKLTKLIKSNVDLDRLVQDDIQAGTQKLKQLVAAADGLQLGEDRLSDTRHYSNVLFNIMRGGIFDNNYQIGKDDFMRYLANANAGILQKNAGLIDKLPVQFSHSDLMQLLNNSNNPDLMRLGIEYLPLKFSRRHGDPSRPWNYFSINTRSEKDGSKILDYEGNWRDIFQNWEALVRSYPAFVEGMIFKFLNASTFDGYNPYRITKAGIDWEVIEPDDPWSYIGYWGDHQIIYLLKFLETIENCYPGKLAALFDKEWFAYAAVPYIIKPYEKILENPKDTIDFDHHWDQSIRKRREQIGADGALLTNVDNQIYHVNFIEKILSTLLAKLSNFIPGAGIWMNTQRPEWNDANNALVGNGVSMVTLYYLHRFMKFFQTILEHGAVNNVNISAELYDFYLKINSTLDKYSPLLTASVSNQNRREIIDQLGSAASEYRQQIYAEGFKGEKQSISLADLNKFIRLGIAFAEQTIRANRRTDGLYHAYNLMTTDESGITVSRLDEMLEGQVAVLSANYLDAAEALDVLNALKASVLFREDQYSYILYPNKELPGFLQRNHVPAEDVQVSQLLAKMMAEGNNEVIEQDVDGNFHFNANFKNAADLKAKLDSINEPDYQVLIAKDKEHLLAVFEKVFNHKAFTGRSGTFYSYEGLGSIYWHMVSKLLLAVQECCLKAIEAKADPVIIGGLYDHYYEIKAGIGVHKSPDLYGAFPTDPYSHTPFHRGAQQPGMTGQVKEDVLARFGELGVKYHEGCIHFEPDLLQKSEFLTSAQAFEYYDIHGNHKHLSLNPGQLAFTICQVPVVYSLSEKEYVEVFYTGAQPERFLGNTLEQTVSQQVFSRSGNIENIVVYVRK